MRCEVVTVPCLDGALLEVQVGGQDHAPTLVLLQGQASSHDWWTDLRARYEDGFQTVTMDYRGTGATRSPDGDLTTRLLGHDVIAVLDALGVGQAHVYGASMGGRVAQMTAADHPARVQSLVLACTSPGGKHATERSNEVRTALVDPDENARLAALVSLFYTPTWGQDPSRSRLLGDPTMSTVDRQRHLKLSARHDAVEPLTHHHLPHPGAARQRRRNDTTSERAAHRRPDPRRRAANTQRRTAWILRRVRPPTSTRSCAVSGRASNRRATTSTPSRSGCVMFFLSFS